MTVDEFLARARSQMGKKTVYKLGAGNKNPKSSFCFDKDKTCDCSGFVTWALGISRQTTHPLYVKFNGGWVNTDGIVMDALTDTGFFRRLPVPTVGGLLVYPRQKVTKTVGHVGIITEVDATSGLPAKVLHCSAGNFRSTGDAIQETPPTVFSKPDCIVAWYEGLTA